MSTFRHIILTALLVFVAGCSEEPIDIVGTGHPDGEKITVMLGCGDRNSIVIEESTRTALADDGISLKWGDDDHISLWAQTTGGQTVVDGADFALWRRGSTWDKAYFRGDVAPMTEGTYNYYAASPRPAATEGTTIRYNLPSVQDGEFHSEWNILMAEPVTGVKQLQQGYNDDVNLQFKPRVHILRIAIPNNGLGEGITRMDISFPQDVAGTLAFDYTNPSATPTVEDGTETITLQFAEPKDAGDVVYAFIAPGVMTDIVSIKSTGVISESAVQTFTGKTFEGGHITPLNYNVKFGAMLGTMIRFTLAEAGANTLGERINSFTLTSTNGALFDNGQTTRSFDYNESGVYEMVFLDANGIDPTQFNGTNVSITFDSDNALIPLADAVAMGTIVSKQKNTIALPNVPYLLAQDFSAAGGFDTNTSNGTGATSGGSNDSKELGSIGADWYGARVAVSAGKSLRICSRNECAAGVRGSYHGRVDTPTLSWLKGSCNIRVSYNYSMGRSSNQGNTLQPYFAVGVSNSSDRNTTSDTWGTLVSDGSTSILQFAIPSPSGYDLNDSGALNGSYDNVNLYGSYTATASNDMYLTWEVYMKEGEPKNWRKYYYSNNWLYIDNIKVQIAN